MGYISILHPSPCARRSTYMATRWNKIGKLIWLKSNSEEKELFFNCINTKMHHKNYRYICAGTRGGAVWGRKWAAEGTIALLCLAAGPSHGILTLKFLCGSTPHVIFFRLSVVFVVSSNSRKSKNNPMSWVLQSTQQNKALTSAGSWRSLLTRAWTAAFLTMLLQAMSWKIYKSVRCSGNKAIQHFQ